MTNLQRKVGAHAAHVVIRLDTLQWIDEHENTPIGELACMDGPLSTLFYLRSVTLETIDKDESVELVQYLPLLRNSGMLRQRSCAEALEQARHARDETSHPDEVAGEQDHILSPLWYNLDEYTVHDRIRWSVFRGTWCLNSIVLIASLYRLQRGPNEFEALERYLEATRQRCRRRAAETQPLPTTGTASAG